MHTQNLTNQKNDLHHKLHAFVCSSIAVRKTLLKNDKSHRNKMLMVNNITALERLMQANNYNSTRKMAGFFLRHSDKIESILPGQGSKSHLYFYEKFYELRRKALVYSENKMVGV